MTAARVLLAPPLLWATHFLVVYVFVSLACLWRWHDVSVLGLPLVHAAVALVTLAFAAMVAALTVAAARLPGFRGRAGLGIGLLFTAAVLMVGLPTLLAPACR